jgi:hypothetical protein
MFNIDIKQDGDKMSCMDQTSQYKFTGFFLPEACLPETIELKDGVNVGDTVGYAISGKLQGVTRECEWLVPPHVAFANLRAEDPKAAEAFIKQYGLLRNYDEKVVTNEEGRYLRSDFTVFGPSLIRDRDTFRKLWRDENVDPLHLMHIEDELCFDVHVELSLDGDVDLVPRDLWTLIHFLFQRDYVKLGYCENPDCPAPYFIKRRKTQKFCEAGPCVVFKQRQYALRWWNTEGKERRHHRQERQAKLKKMKKSKAKRGR